MDECDARRDECVTVMSDIERQFSGLKEQLYRERHEQIELKLSQVRAGRSSEYVGPLQKLEENMQIRRQVAGVLKGFRTTGKLPLRLFYLHMLHGGKHDLAIASWFFPLTTSIIFL